MNITSMEIEKLKVAKPIGAEPTDSIPRMYRVNDFARKHNLAIGGLRHLIFFEKENGFHRCIRRIGRSVYILEGAFFKWVDEINGVKQDV